MLHLHLRKIDRGIEGDSAVEGESGRAWRLSLITNLHDVNRALTRFHVLARVNCETLWLSSHLRHINLWLPGEGNDYDITATFPLILSSRLIGHEVKSRQLLRVIIIKARGSNNEQVMNVCTSRSRGNVRKSG